jgi:ribosomal-protein-alanine N-acetyltransferase
MTILTPKSKRFVLRPITIKDAKVYYECQSDAEAKRNFMSVPKNLIEAKNEISKNLNKNSLNFAIEVNGEVAGFVHLELNDKPNYKHSAIIGYGIHPKFRGKGLATEAAKLVTEYGFKKLKLKRITGMCRTFNKASARVLEKAGYRLEGILKKNKFKNGKYLDDMLWANVR